MHALESLVVSMAKHLESDVMEAASPGDITATSRAASTALTAAAISTRNLRNLYRSTAAAFEGRDCKDVVYVEKELGDLNKGIYGSSTPQRESWMEVLLRVQKQAVVMMADEKDKTRNDDEVLVKPNVRERLVVMGREC